MYECLPWHDVTHVLYTPLTPRKPAFLAVPLPNPALDPPTPAQTDAAPYRQVLLLFMLLPTW